MAESPRIDVKVTAESGVEAVKLALLLLAARAGSRETFIREAEEHTRAILGDVELSDEAVQILAHRIVHYILGLGLVGSWALDELEAKAVNRQDWMVEAERVARSGFRSESRG